MTDAKYYLRPYWEEPIPAIFGVRKLLRSAYPMELDADIDQNLEWQIEDRFKRDCMFTGFQAGVDYILDIIGHGAIFKPHD